MKNWTKKDMKITAQKALEAEYGFAPAISKIILLEASGDRTYIYFRVRDQRYTFRSTIDVYGVDESGEPLEAIWVGRGTLEKET